ncbi:MAG: DUF2202 domain-containing protein [Deltaproteobacteria bacterium]|nr:DUF2202 domain-containing protein [Deltaproteobacteria bacterium]
MKKKFTVILLLFGMLALCYNVYAVELYGAKGAEQSDDPTLEQMLVYAIQDEYLAHAEYEYIINQYGSIRPFSNIIKAEETHIAMLKPLFEKYGFKLPEDKGGDHVLVPKDLRQAFEAGVQAEIDNIAMYEKFLSKNLADDVRSAFQMLKNASENHLRAFQNGLSRY